MACCGCCRRRIKKKRLPYSKWLQMLRLHRPPARSPPLRPTFPDATYSMADNWNIQCQSNDWRPLSRRRRFDRYLPNIGVPKYRYASLQLYQLMCVLTSPILNIGERFRKPALQRHTQNTLMQPYNFFGCFCSRFGYASEFFFLFSFYLCTLFLSWRCVCVCVNV